MWKPRGFCCGSQSRDNRSSSRFLYASFSSSVKKDESIRANQLSREEILQRFYGIGTREMTLEEIGDEYGLTRERVRQIKEKALRGLRKSSRSEILKPYL